MIEPHPEQQGHTLQVSLQGSLMERGRSVGGGVSVIITITITIMITIMITACRVPIIINMIAVGGQSVAIRRKYGLQ